MSNTWINLTPSVPIVSDFASTRGQGSPICIDVSTGVPYYLATGDVVTPLGLGGLSGYKPLVDGSNPPVFIINTDNDLIMVPM